MKELSKILLLSLISLVFTACGDDSPEMDSVQRTVEYEFVWPVRGLEEGATKYEFELNLDEVIGVDAARYFKSGEFQNASSYLIVEGLDAMNPSPTLKDFSLQLGNGTPVKFGNCTVDPKSSGDFASELRQSSNNVISFLSSVFTAYASKSGYAVITVSFVPTHDILIADGVELKLVITGTYNYEVVK